MPRVEEKWGLTPIQIRTKRLIIQRFEATDVSDEYISWLNDRDHMRYSNQRFVTHTRETVDAYRESFSAPDDEFLAIKLLDCQQLVGTATVNAAVPHGVADIGILIGTSHSCRGYGQEAVGAIAEELIRKSFRKVTIGASSRNTKMLKVIRRLGFRPDGTRIKHEIIAGEEVDILYFARF